MSFYQVLLKDAQLIHSLSMLYDFPFPSKQNLTFDLELLITYLGAHVTSFSSTFCPEVVKESAYKGLEDCSHDPAARVNLILQQDLKSVQRFMRFVILK